MVDTRSKKDSKELKGNEDVEMVQAEPEKTEEEKAAESATLLLAGDYLVTGPPGHEKLEHCFIDIKQNIGLIEKGVTALEARYTTRALRATASIRRRLNADILAQAIEAHFPKGNTACASQYQWNTHLLWK